ncbi:dense core granule exocytosis [Homalodisca vitripennis]|nr:dense core granule exocytosis [Homalodisca vitripennis]
MIVPPSKKLEDLIHLAELCVDLLQQNEEHYAEEMNVMKENQTNMHVRKEFVNGWHNKELLVNQTRDTQTKL